MSTRRKLLLGALSVLPLVYMGVFFAWIIYFFTTNGDGSEPAGATAIVVAHIATMVLIFGLLIYYIVDIVRGGRVQGDERVLWIVLIVIANALAFPVYWWMYVWREPQPRGAQPPPRPSNPPPIRQT